MELSKTSLIVVGTIGGLLIITAIVFGILIASGVFKDKRTRGPTVVPTVPTIPIPVPLAPCIEEGTTFVSTGDGVYGEALTMSTDGQFIVTGVQATGANTQQLQRADIDASTGKYTYSSIKVPATALTTDEIGKGIIISQDNAAVCYVQGPTSLDATDLVYKCTSLTATPSDSITTTLFGFSDVSKIGPLMVFDDTADSVVLFSHLGDGTISDPGFMLIHSNALSSLVQTILAPGTVPSVFNFGEAFVQSGNSLIVLGTLNGSDVSILHYFNRVDSSSVWEFTFSAGAHDEFMGWDDLNKLAGVKGFLMTPDGLTMYLPAPYAKDPDGNSNVGAITVYKRSSNTEIFVPSSVFSSGRTDPNNFGFNPRFYRDDIIMVSDLTTLFAFNVNGTEEILDASFQFLLADGVGAFNPTQVSQTVYNEKIPVAVSRIDTQTGPNNLEVLNVCIENIV